MASAAAEISPSSLDALIALAEAGLHASARALAGAAGKNLSVGAARAADLAILR